MRFLLIGTILWLVQSTVNMSNSSNSSNFESISNILNITNSSNIVSPVNITISPVNTTNSSIVSSVNTRNLSIISPVNTTNSSNIVSYVNTTNSSNIVSYVNTTNSSIVSPVNTTNSSNIVSPENYTNLLKKIKSPRNLDIIYVIKILFSIVTCLVIIKSINMIYNRNNNKKRKYSDNFEIPFTTHQVYKSKTNENCYKRSHSTSELNV
jgi:hypothetical protein